MEPGLKKPSHGQPTEAGPAPLIAPRPSLGDEAYELMLAELISLRIPPGEKLSVDGLARQFGVSQTPIRAALIRLEAEGLVVKKHNTGYNVAPQLSGSRFRDIYEFRLLIEPAAAAAAALLATPSEVAALTELAEEMSALADTDTEANYSKFALMDGEFHARIAEAGRNTVICEALERLYTHMHLFRLRYHAAVAMDAVKEHDAIMRAIREGDGAAAQATMQAHIAASRDRMQPYFNAT